MNLATQLQIPKLELKIPKLRVQLTDEEIKSVGKIYKPEKMAGAGHDEFDGADITPEDLAYALPGGLAKLVMPKWIYGAHLKMIEDRILRMAAGEPIRLVVSCPPRHGKTLFLSRILPAWFLGRNPDKRVILITYQQEFSKKQSRAARNYFKRFGPSVFGYSVDEASAAAGSWDIQDHEGGMEAIGAEGSITGKGADLLLLDDMIKGLEVATNPAQMERQWEWFGTDVYTRLEPGASVIVLMTRWSTMDLIGQLTLANGAEGWDEWEFINLPAFAESNDPLSREVGEALFPERYNEENLNRMKANPAMTDFWWESLYQGHPTTMKGAIVNTEWFQRYENPPQREAAELCVISADTANKEKEVNDYTVFGVWLVYQDGYYLVDVLRDRMQHPALIETATAFQQRWKPDYFLIEDKGSGTSLIQHMKGIANTVAIDPGNENKVLRMQNETPAIKVGRVYLPLEDRAHWVKDYIGEMREFPRGYKDQVDMTSQFLKYMNNQDNNLQMW